MIGHVCPEAQEGGPIALVQVSLDGGVGWVEAGAWNMPGGTPAPRVPHVLNLCAPSY